MDLPIAQVGGGAKQTGRSGLGGSSEQGATPCREAERQAATIVVRGFSGYEALLDQSAHDHAHGADIGVGAFGELRQRCCRTVSQAA